MAEEMPRLFVPQDQLPFITGSDVHYIKDVLRMKPGDKLEILDGTGNIYTAMINQIENEEIKLDILGAKKSEVEPKTTITLAQSLPKAKKMDFIVQKCTELGVSEIVPVVTERSVARGDKTERWQKIAKEAAEQSGRGTIPKILPLMDFQEVLKLRNKFNLALIPWEIEKASTLKNIFSDPLISRSSDILIIIGPEGGFSNQEVEAARAAGFIPVSLGKRILRTETAGMAILSMIMYAIDE